MQKNLLIQLLLMAIGSVANAAQQDVTHRFEAENLNFEMKLRQDNQAKLANRPKQTDIKATFIAKEKRTGNPIGKLRPHIWLSLRRSEQVATETSCEAKVRSFTSGQLATRADVDLNSYYLLTLNQDKTVAFINPQVASNNKLEGIVQLPEQGLDWVLTKDSKWLYVTMPEAAGVALIDTTNHSLVTTILTGTGSKPTRIALAPDEQSVWVGLDGSPNVAVIGRGAKPKVSLVEAGEGLHQISFTPDNKLAVVTNTAANTVSIINAGTLKKTDNVKVGATPLKAVWMEKAERFYVIAVNDPAMSVVDPVKGTVEAQIEIGRGAVDIAPDPQGRYVWVVNQLDAKTYVIDSATNTKIAFANTSAEPDQIAFTADYAYVRGLGSEKFALFNRKQLEKLPAHSGDKQNGKLAELSVTQIQAGEKPPSALPDSIGVAAMIAPVPEQNGV
ncbi:MAG: YncE family protein, partial [Methyloglobulus sp.]|nr:YncE family protein [Methyloglobulus sp.]